ncbi:MAG: T9SS type A sorting domain-containing protein [Bacteroidota bacterium]
MKHFNSFKRTLQLFILLLFSFLNSINYARAQCGTVSAYKPSVSSDVTCSGNNVYVYATGLPVTSWIYRDNNIGSWQVFSSGSDNASQFVNVSTTTIRRYRAVISTLSCPTDTTLPVEVTINPASYGTNTAIKLSASAEHICSGSQATLRMMNQGVQVVAWLYRENGGQWQAYSFTSSQQISVTMPATLIPITREWRTLIKVNSCQQDSSAILTTNILPLVAGINPNIKPVSAQGTICGGTSVNLQVEWGGTIGNWIYKDADSTTWKVLTSGSSNVNDFNTNLNASTIREYKVILKALNNCSADTSASYFVNVNASLRRVLTTIQPRITSAATQICAGNSMQFQLQGYTNIQGWFYKDSATGNWNSFGGTSTSASLSSQSNFTKDLNREIKVIINNSSLSCSIDSSASVFYMVKANVRGNSTTAIPFANASEMCAGTQAVIYLQNGLTVNNWLYRNNGTGNWTNAGSSGNQYTDFNTSSFTINTMRAYRAVLNNTATCRIDTTAEVQILYKPAIPGGNVAITPTVNAPAYCSGTTVSGNINPSSSAYQMVKWVYRDNNTGIWNDLLFQSSTSFSDNNTTLPVTTIRSYKALVRNLETYRIDTSAAVSVTINPVGRGTIGVVPTTLVSSVCNESSVQLTVLPPTGYSANNWIYKDTVNQSWTLFSSGSTTAFNSVSTQNTSRMYRVVLLNSSNCRFDTTNAITLVVVKKVNRNNGSYLPTITTTNICSGTTYSMNVQLNNGANVLRWIYRDNNSVWKEISSTSTTYFESVNNTKVLVPTTREYKVLINDNNNCVIDTSAGVTITINPLSNGATSGITPVSSFSAYCSGLNLPVSISYTGNVQKWMYRDNGAAWREFTFGTASTNINDNNSYVPVNTDREYRALLIRPNTCIIDTTQILTIQLKPYVYGNAGAIQPTATAATVCSGSTVSMNINSGTGYSVHKWIFSESGSGWRDLINSSASTSYFETNTNVTANTLRSYRAIIQTNTCSYDTTTQVNVLMNARTYGYASAVTLSSANGVYCAASTISVNVVSSTMPSGASVIRWVYMDNGNGIWNAIPSSSTSFLSHSFTSVISTTTRSYRAIINNTTTCSYDSSSIFSVTINPSAKGYATTITPTISSAIVCNANTTPSLFVSLPSGYSVLKWMVNTNGTGWSDFGYNTANTSISDFNTSVQSPASRSYRVLLSNTINCSIDSSNIVGATINPAIRGNLVTTVPISVRSNYCYSKQVSVSVTPPSGYSVEKWIYSDNSGPWNDFTNSTANTTLTDNNTYVPALMGRAYRAILSNTGTCQKDSTAAFTVILNPRNSNIGLRSITPTTSPATGICSGSSVTVLVNPGTGNEIYKWTYSNDGVQWYDAINSYNNSNYAHNTTHTATPLVRLYRAIITDTSSCDFDSTQAVSVAITPITYGKDTSTVINGLDTVCIGTMVSLSVTPGSGNSVTKWIYRDNNGPWKDFTNSTQSSTLSDPNTLLAVGALRGYTPLLYKTSVCRIDTLTKVKTVYFKNKTYGNNTTSVNINSDTVCSGNSVSMNTSGSIERWLYRDGTTGAWNTIATASTFLSHTATTVSSSVWRYYRALASTGSCNADSTNYDSVFIKVQGYGNVAAAPTVTNSTICAGNGVPLSLSLSGATMQRWIYRDNATGGWNTFSTSTSFFVTDYNTGVAAVVSREYRAIVFRTCSYDTTNAVVVTISPKTRGTDATKVPTVASTTVCAASAVQNIQVTQGSGNSIIQWLYNDNNGNWKVLSNGNQNNINDYNTLVGTTITRRYAAIIDNNLTCRYDTSAAVIVTISPVVLGNSSRKPTASATACMGSNYNVSMNVVSDTTVIRFLYNTNGGAYVDRGYITPSTNQTITDYAYNGASYTMGYRAMLFKASNCHIDTTAATIITVNPRTFGTDNTITPTSSANVCSGSNFNVNISAGSGNSISHWIYRDNGGSWIGYYSSANNITQQAVTTTSLTRQYRALIIKGSSCTTDTSNAVTVTVNPIVYGYDSTAQVTINSGSSGCTGASVSVSVTPGSNSVNTWLYRDNSNWNNMYLNSTSITDFNTFVSSPITRIYGVLIWKSATCRMDTTTKTDTIIITPRSSGYDSSITIAPSATSICIGTSVSLTATVGTHSVEKWYYQDNGGVWNMLSSSTSAITTDYNTGVSVPTTRIYRALIRKSNACAFDTSNTATVSINPRSVGVDNAITPTANNANICSGGVISVAVVPGSGNSVQKWLYSQDGSAWMDYAMTTATTIGDYNTAVTATTVRRYRAIIVKGSGCALDTSAFATVTLNPIGFGNQNTVVPTVSKAAICSGSSVTVTASGFSGTSVLRWLYKDNGVDPWNVVYSSSTSFTDFNTITSSTITRQYRAIVNNNSGCSTDTTAASTVSISPITNGTIATATQSSQTVVCSGNPINVFINPPSGRIVTSWLSREIGGAWTVFNGSSATSVNDFATTVTANTTREYRTILSNAAGCSLDSSAGVSVSVNVITHGTNLSIIPSTNTPSLCSGSAAIVGVSGFSGNVVNWIFRDSVVNGWSSIGNTNFTLIHTNTFVSYPRVREYRAIVFNANNCSNDTTATVQMQINPQLAGNANAIVPTGNVTKVCTGGSITLSAAGFINGGSVTGWVYNDNGGAWTLITGAMGASYTHSNIVVTALTNRQYRALVLTGCITDTTAALPVTMDKFPTKPTITEVTGTDSLICSETAATYEWRLNGNVIPAATGKVHVSTASGTYTVQIGNTADCKTVSDAFIHAQVGLENVFANVQLAVYPNPTQDGTVMIDWNGLPVTQAKVRVTDMLGRVVIERETQVLGTNGTTIDLAQHNGGIYFIVLSANGSSSSYKVLYNK